MDLVEENILQSHILAVVEENILRSHILAVVEENIMQAHNPPTYTICRFPEFLVDIDDKIRPPQLASFGPCHSSTPRLSKFNDRKLELQLNFLSRVVGPGSDLLFYRPSLMELTQKIRSCYSGDIVIPLDDVLVTMMLLDGSFMLELFLEYDQGRLDWPWPVQTLIADLLNLENQLPFFVLEKLFHLSGIDPDATSHTLPNLAFRFLNQAFRGPPANSQIQEPMHLLDLFRRSLLPSIKPDPQQSNHDSWMHPIPSVKNLRSAGITVRQKTARSLLEIEIDFRKFHIPLLALKIPPLALKIPPFALKIPPFALKIPPLDINDVTKAILVNCVAMEQCFGDQSKHFTAYVRFMSCLIQQPEDVGCLRSVDIIRGYSQDEARFIRMLYGIGTKASYTRRECYLWKPFREIQSYYNSCWASIRRTLLAFNNIILYCSLLQIAIGILSWRFPGK